MQPAERIFLTSTSSVGALPAMPAGITTARTGQQQNGSTRVNYMSRFFNKEFFI